MIRGDIMAKYQMLRVKDLVSCEMREVRECALEKLREAINGNGIDEAKPLLILKKDDKYLVAENGVI